MFVFLFQAVIETWGLTGQHVRDFTLYSGVLGTAYLLFRAYLVTANKTDLGLCSEIVKACDSASLGSRFTFYPHDINCFWVLDCISVCVLFGIWDLS